MNLLGLTYPTTHEALKAAYRAACRRLHPDAGGSHTQFIALQTEYRRVKADPLTFRSATPPKAQRFNFPTTNFSHSGVVTPPEAYAWMHRHPPPPPASRAPQPTHAEPSRTQQRRARRKRAKLRAKLRKEQACESAREPVTYDNVSDAIHEAERWIQERASFYMDVGFPPDEARQQGSRDRHRVTTRRNGAAA